MQERDQGFQKPARQVLPVLQLQLLLQETVGASGVALPPVGASGMMAQMDALVFEPPGEAFSDALEGLQRRILAVADSVPRLLLSPQLQVRRAGVVGSKRDAC